METFLPELRRLLERHFPGAAEEQLAGLIITLIVIFKHEDGKGDIEDLIGLIRRNAGELYTIKVASTKVT